MRPGRGRAGARVLVGGALTLCGLLLPAGIAVGAAAAARAAPSLATVVIANPGPGYTVTSEGPLNRSRFASRLPDPVAAAGAFATLARTISTYERVWVDDGGSNQVQDLVVGFPSVVGAQVFLQAMVRALGSGEIVSAGPLAPIPGARRTIYFSPSTRAGVGQAITMRAGTDVAVLSFFSASAGKAQPVSPADALRAAQAQHAAMVAAPGGTVATPGAGASKGPSLATLGWAALAVAVLALAVATPVVLRRHRAAGPGPGPGPQPVIRSEGPS
ncbi:MAG: hypothetical protein ACLPYY_14405 [Acidimicrobiales bacterium]